MEKLYQKSKTEWRISQILMSRLGLTMILMVKFSIYVNRIVCVMPLLSVIKANSADLDQTPRPAASDLGLYSLPMSQIRFYR